MWMLHAARAIFGVSKNHENASKKDRWFYGDLSSEFRQK
jgi:hypothetical protein